MLCTSISASRMEWLLQSRAQMGTYVINEHQAVLETLFINQLHE